VSSVPRNLRDVVSKLDELLAEGTALVDGFRKVAEVNDAFVAGNQYGGVTFKNNQTVITKDEWPDGEEVPRIHVNILGNLVSTVVSLLTKNRPCAISRPLNEDDVEAVYQGEVANTLIRYLSQELKTVEVIQKALKLAVTHGSGGIKVWMDAKTRKAVIAPVSLFNVTIDPAAETVQESGWFIFHRWMKPADAQKLMPPNMAHRLPKDEEYTTASGVKKRGVRAYELWIRPGVDDDYPRGIYALVVDKVVVESTDYPFIVQTEGGEESLPPLVWITAKMVEECIYGRTSVTDCVPLQRTLNETFARTLKLIRLSTSPKRIQPDQVGEGADMYRDAVITLPVTEAGVQAAKIMGWETPPPFPPQLAENVEWCIKQIHDIIGVAPLTAGTETRNVSGKALDIIEGLDEQKNSQTTRSIETAVLELYRILLALVQLFYEDGRKLQIVGGSRVEVLLFNKADVMGSDLRLEPSSEFDLMQPVQEQQALEKQNAGLTGVASVHAAARDPRTAFSRATAEKLVQQVLAGEDVDIEPGDVDPESFKAVIAKHKHLAMLQGRKADYMALVEFEKFVTELGMQSDRAAPPQAPAEAPQSVPPGTPPVPTPPPPGVVQ
jgi:hypothetical protein